MLKTPHNYKTVTLKLNRIDVCELLIALNLISEKSEAKKWGTLHDKLREILDDFDKKHPVED